jgi:multisubunit Na+/H+ antiporter MnhB subunit
MSKRNAAAVIFFAIVAVFFVFSALMMHPFGEPEKTEMDQYIIDNTQNETGADNGVTSVVFDYRGFDTLGEATVLFTAVAGVILIFRRLKK